MSFSCFVLAGINDNNNAWMKGGSTSNGTSQKRENHGFFIRGDVKVLKMQEENLAFVLEKDDTSAFEDLKAINPDFDWNLGFRAGLGYITGHDDIEVNANWYYFYGKGDRSIEKQSDTTLIPLFNVGAVPIGQTFFSANGHIKTQVHQIDLNLAKLFVVGTRLFIKAAAGLEAMWMRQGYTIKYLFLDQQLNPADTDEFGSRMHFWGIGPKFALHSFWQLFRKIGPIAEIDASMFYGVFKTTNEFIKNDTTQERLVNHYRITRFVLNALLGLEFRHWFEKSDVHLRFRLGWENAIYFDQGRMVQFSLQPVFNMIPGDLTYQGWIFGFYLGF